MKIELRSPKSLLAYGNNARTHSDEQIQELANSITAFGFNDPIEIGEDGVIISGHARAQAAIKAGLEFVPVVTLVGMDESARKAYILAANRIAQNAGWDSDLLKIELGDLLADEFDITLTGFTQDEINAYLNPEVLNLGESDEDEEGEGKAGDPVSKLGDVWICGNHRIACGDSTNPDDVARLLNGHEPNLMVTDPPYGVDYDPSWREGADLGVGKRSKGKVLNDTVVDWTDAYSLFTGDVVYVWHAGKYTHTVSQNVIDCGFDIVSQIIWVKQHFALSRGDYHWQHEPCVYAVRKGAKHNWQGARDQSTTWQIKNNNSFGNSEKEETFGHGTQKPVECMARPIKNNTMPNDYVYDPFSGSGTTMIACEKLGRRCLTQELDPGYVDMAVRRWEKFTGLKATLESTGENLDG
jgi:DNA modification methylase